MFQVWITALTVYYERDIIHNLVNRGYMVCATSGQQVSLQNEKVAGVVIALQISRPDCNSVAIHSDLLEVLDQIKAKFYSIIISPASQEALWNSGNFEIKPVSYLTHLN